MGGDDGVDGRRVQVVAVLVGLGALLVLPLVVATGSDFIGGGGMTPHGRVWYWTTIAVGLAASLVGAVQGWRRASAAGFVPGVLLLLVLIAIAALVHFP
ncbi:hypothetical protein ACRQ4B_10925 [Curtobacterium sp. SP.BCo]|uniref:hypothetical protein n=1 Tax=Curtobacterium sp. SP.BCo TaxID=3435229 RepID=UPI003F732A74